MPIEIRELHIRVAVTASAAPASANATPGSSAPAAPAEHDALVAECVEQVLQILQSKGER